MSLMASDFDKSKYLRAEDITEPKKFRIKAVADEGFDKDGGKERKLVLWFSNHEQGLVLNKTNIRALRGGFGDDTTAWIGKVIVIFQVMTEFRGQAKPGLRVRIPPPKEAATSVGNGSTVTEEDEFGTEKTPPKDDMQDEIPF